MREVEIRVLVIYSNMDSHSTYSKAYGRDISLTMFYSHCALPIVISLNSTVHFVRVTRAS